MPEMATSQSRRQRESKTVAMSTAGRLHDVASDSRAPAVEHLRPGQRIIRPTRPTCGGSPDVTAPLIQIALYTGGFSSRVPPSTVDDLCALDPA